MKIKTILAYLWKLFYVSIDFFVGMALGMALLPTFGLQSSVILDGSNPRTIFFLFPWQMCFPRSWTAC